MSEEEKKAIENVKSMFEDITIEELLKDKNFNITIYSLGILDILRVIAIVEKRQKEIKKYKKFIEDKTKIGKDIQTFINKGYVEQEYISKDKIREILDNIEKNIEEDRPSIVLENLILNIEELLGEKDDTKI